MPKLTSPTANAFEKLLRQYYSHPNQACRNLLPSRHYATTESTSISKFKHPITEVAVIGGGITGLASAYYLSTSLPDTKITLFELSSRLGGWLHSKTVDVGNGKIIFEQGPRSLRPNTINASVTLDLISRLNLEDQILRTPKNSVAAQNRFIYYPDHLVRMPSSSFGLEDVYTILKEPLFNGLLRGSLRELVAVRPENLSDESVGSFISRRLGPSIADNIASAFYHGIYAGDIYKLSARSLLPGLYFTEALHGSITRATINRTPKIYPEEDLFLLKKPAPANMVDTSIFTLKGGLGSLADTLVAELEKNPNVTIRKEEKVQTLGEPSWNPGMRIKISSFPKNPSRTGGYYINRHDFSHVISTISGTDLFLRLLGDSMFSLITHSVTVMVVNLFFSNPEILPVQGFGYLIPRSVPFSENPEFALGVIFDSDATKGQDAVPGTKVTVMLGGHWWDGWGTYPDEDHGASMAKAVLKRHLGIDEAPVATRVSLQKDCIPQYFVGHDTRMGLASKELEKYEGRLRVAGNSFTGVGLNDCVRAARDVVTGLVEGTGKTGLEKFVGGRRFRNVRESR